MKLLFENLQTFLPEPEELAGKWEIPVIKPTYQVPTDAQCIGFNYAKGCKSPGDVGIHFFLDDAQFVRVWNSPDTYIPLLSQFRYLCAPDFSMYSDMPKVLQMYNHYRKHWLAAYWQELGLMVIPTISWSTPDSFEWCFDGEPENSVVAVGTAGTQAAPWSRPDCRSTDKRGRTTVETKSRHKEPWRVMGEELPIDSTSPPA